MATIFYLKKGETIPPLEVQLINIDPGINPLLNASSVTFRLKSNKNNSVLLEKAAVINDIPTSKVSYVWYSADVANIPANTYNAEFVVTYIDNSKRTYPNDGFITVKIT